MKSKKYLIIILSLIVLCVVGTVARRIYEMGPRLDSVSAFNNKRVTVGVPKGYIFEERVDELLPNAVVKVFETREEVYKALESGEINGAVDDEPIIRARMRGVERLNKIDGLVESSDYSFIFPIDERGKELRDQYTEYVQKLKSSGELESLDNKWFGNDTDNKVSEEFSDLPDTNGSITVAYSGSEVPFAYKSRDKIVGYEIDILIGFCREYGYKPDMVQTSFSQVLAGVSGKRFDVGIGAITISDKRAKAMYFGEPDYSGGIAICTMQREAEKHGGFLFAIKDDFHDAFVEGNRLRIFAGGIIATLLMVLAAVLAGTPMGVIIFLLSQRGNLLVRGLSTLLAWLIHGIPAIMIIMSLYYSYYENVYFGGFVAAAIGFAFIFGEEVYRLIRRNAMKIGDGEFVRDLRVDNITPSEFFQYLTIKSGEDVVEDYREAIIRLVKMTSVVGYISVQDMTKVFNSIRTESLETAMPLFVTTVTYFLIIALISRIFRYRGRKEKEEE